MLDKWFGFKIHHSLHLLGLMVLAFGLPMNKVLMSIGAIWGVSNLILEGRYLEYWENLKKNNGFLLLFSFFILHIVAMLWSENIAYGLHDLKVKLPLLAVPLALVAHPVSKKSEVHTLLITFLFSLLICSIVNFKFFLESISINSPENFREMSLFGSHIRFAILIVIGTVISLYFAWKLPKYLLFFILLAFWFLTYTFYSQVISGALSLFFAVVFFLIYFGWKYTWFKLFSAFAFILTLVLVVHFMRNFGNDLKHPKQIKLEKKTAQGHAYYHDTLHTVYQEGRNVYLHICDEELLIAWPNYSEINYMGMDAKNYPIRETIYRYMTAKNLKKDANGLTKLSKKDIQNIENGVTSPQMLQTGFLARINSLKYQLENTENPNGHSLLQRLEFWKTGLKICSENLIFGVGTGDVQEAFNEQYQKNKTPLLPENWLRGHNMFLTIQITFGLFGSILFLVFLLTFLQKNYQSCNLLGFVLSGVIIASFFIEDTLETQTGVSLFSLFFALFLPNSVVDTKQEHNS